MVSRQLVGRHVSEPLLPGCVSDRGIYRWYPVRWAATSVSRCCWPSVRRSGFRSAGRPPAEGSCSGAASTAPTCSSQTSDVIPTDRRRLGVTSRPTPVSCSPAVTALHYGRPSSTPDNATPSSATFRIILLCILLLQTMLLRPSSLYNYTLYTSTPSSATPHIMLLRPSATPHIMLLRPVLLSTLCYSVQCYSVLYATPSSATPYIMLLRPVIFRTLCYSVQSSAAAVQSTRRPSAQCCPV